MAEDVLHRKLMAYCCDALEFFFADRPDVLVAGNDFVYYSAKNSPMKNSPKSYTKKIVSKGRYAQVQGQRSGLMLLGSVLLCPSPIPD